MCPTSDKYYSTCRPPASKINKKGKLGFTELEYLGYLVGSGCLKPQPKMVSVILTAARLQTNGPVLGARWLQQPLHS